MSLTPHIDLVCFDLGGVLVRCVDDWAHACQLADIPELISDADPVTRQRIINASAKFETAMIDLGGFAQTIADDSDYEPAHVEKVIGCWLVELYPGAAELVGELKATGVKTACLSNTNHLHWGQMTDAAGPFAATLGQLDHLHASHLLRARKPDPTIYEKFEAAVGVDADAILFFDDREDNVTAAVHAMWHAERIDPRKDPIPQIRKYLKRYAVL